LERDREVQVESLDILESDIDGQIYKDLFATDNTDNAFTATEEVLIDPVDTSINLDKLFSTTVEYV
jgi:hypothetical protein